PKIPDSANGVSNTRSSPCFACRPSVTLKTPPFGPMSSPNNNTFSSFVNLESKASLIACTIVFSLIVIHLPFFVFSNLFLNILRRNVIHVFQEVRHFLFLSLSNSCNGFFDFLFTCFDYFFFLFFTPYPFSFKVLGHANDWIFFFPLTKFFIYTITSRIV